VPGSYADTLLPAETNFYRVRLQKGQRLDVRVAIDTSRFGGPGEANEVQGIRNLFYRLNLYTPLRQSIIDANELLTGSENLESATAQTSLALGYEQIFGGDYTDDEFKGPGDYYVSVNASDVITEANTPVEIPLQLDIRRTGVAQGSSPNFASALPRPRDDSAQPGANTETGTGPFSQGGDAEEGSPLASVVVFGVFGLLSGAVLGALGAAMLGRRAA